MRLFLLGERVEQGDVEQHLHRDDVAALCAAGLLRVEDGSMGARLMTIPFQGLMLLADFPEAGEGSSHVEPVYAPGAESRVLFDQRWPDSATTVLDLCAGSGVQAFGAARSATRVVAVEVNPRAVQAAELGRHLNRLDNVEVLAGDLTEPVTDERFELVLANPPFVSTPEWRPGAAYSDGGKYGVDVLERLLDQVPRVLTDGGFCQIVTHLYHFRDHDPESWLRARATRDSWDVFVLEGRRFDSTELVVRQLMGVAPDRATYDAKVHDYLDHLDGNGFEWGSCSLVWFRAGGRGRYESGPLGGSAWAGVEDRERAARYFDRAP
jgi:SAM-dependent methyltransferase